MNGTCKQKKFVLLIFFKNILQRIGEKREKYGKSDEKVRKKYNKVKKKYVKSTEKVSKKQVQFMGTNTKKSIDKSKSDFAKK